MTDKEIIKALECCKPDNEEGCLNCPFDKYPLPKCAEMLSKESINLINRQQSAIDVYMQENDRLKTAYIQVSMDRKEAVTEAIKEFAERLKLEAYTETGMTGYKYQSVVVEDIDNLVKEMVGEQE